MNFVNIKILFSLAILVAQLGALAQNANFYGSEQEEMANCIVEHDGNLFLLGTKRDSESSASNYYVMQLYANGRVKNEFTFGGEHRDIGKHILVRDDGMYILGRTWDGGLPNNDMYFTKVDFEGQQLWARYFGGIHNDFGHKFIQTRDGGFAMAGFVRNQRNGNDWGDLFLVKTDAEGNQLWESSFGEKYIDHGFDVVENNNNELIMVGTLGGFYNPTSIDFLNHDADIVVIKTNSRGEEIWTQIFGGSGHDWAKEIISAPYGGYYVCGSTQSFGAGSFDFFLLKIDENGNEEWIKTYGGKDFDYGETLRIGKDNCLYILGSSASYATDFKPDHLLIKTDLNGNEIWYNTYGTDGSDYSSSLICTKDTSCIFTGWTDLGEHGNKDIVLYKVTAQGQLEVVSTIVSNDPATTISVFPNPARQKFWVELYASYDFEAFFLLCDITGKEIEKHQIRSNQKVELTTNLKSGAYLYQIEKENSVLHSGKIVLTR